MDSARSDPTEHERLLRQQLLLAQVRVMEIEDERDATAARLAEIEKLLSATQRLADTKLDEVAHLTRTLANLQGAYDALSIDRDEKERTRQAIRAALSIAQDDLTKERARRVAAEARIEQFEVEVATITSSRTWRWTGWLRALGQLAKRK